MNNYEYIIASLPVLMRDMRSLGKDSAHSLVEEIRKDCSKKDNELISFLLDGYDEEKMDASFYSKALSHPNSFIRGFFAYDLEVRNAKVDYLNEALGREAGTDNMILDPEKETEKDEKVEEVLRTHDILAREKGIDSLMWEKIDELTLMDVFDIDLILAFIAKLQIVSRWLSLDEQSGREMFRRLVDEVRGSFEGVHYEG